MEPDINANGENMRNHDAEEGTADVPTHALYPDETPFAFASESPAYKNYYKQSTLEA
jgi:hypothetical protein